MKIQELEVLKPYRVIKRSSDSTFLPGEIIWTSENGDINSVQGAGWITPSEVSEMTLDFEVEEAPEFVVIKTNWSETCNLKGLLYKAD